jgi:outer membrane protein assembly factor BamB
MDLSRRRFLRQMGQWVALGGSGLIVACQGGQQQVTVTAQPTAPPATKPAASPAAAASPGGSPLALPSPSPGLAASPSAVAVASPSPAAVAAAAGAGKPMYQMDPQHTGRSASAGPRRLTLLRTFATGAPELMPSDPLVPAPDIQSSAAIGPDGTIYIGNFPGTLFALRDSPSARDQLVLAWRFRPANSSPYHATPAISRDGSTIYMPFTTGAGPQARGALYAVRAPTSGQEGQQVWQADLGQGQVQNSPTLGPDGTLYIVTATTGMLYAIDSSNGNVKWSAQTGTGQQAQFGQTVKVAPALGPDGTVYTTALTGSLYAVSPPSGSGNQGTVKWSFDFGQHLGSTPLVSQPVTAGPNRGQDGVGSAASPTIGPDGTIYVGADNSNFYAIDPSGQQKWLYEAERELAGIWTTACLSQDNQTLYFGANKGGLYALNTRDGTLKWKFDIFASVYSSPALDSRGTLYTGSTVGHVFAVDAANGEQVADDDNTVAIWTAPAIRPDGTLVVGDRNGRILVLGQG